MLGCVEGFCCSTHQLLHRSCDRGGQQRNARFPYLAPAQPARPSAAPTRTPLVIADGIDRGGEDQMGKLKTLPNRLGSLPPALGYMDAPAKKPEAVRDVFAPWRAWYKTARWQKLRWSVLVRDRFTCQRCGHSTGETSQLVADHRTPHRGDERLFWDEGNLNCLCKPCHDRHKQREERRAG